MSDIMQRIGENMRQIRKVRGLTLADIAQAVTDSTGSAIGGGLVGAWQRGQRRISAENLIAISDALGCSVVQLYGRTEALQLIHHLSQHERQIVRFAFDAWEGDVHPLLQLMGLYMASQVETRAEIAANAIRVYTDAVKNGMHPNAPYKVRTSYIRQKWGDLIDQAQRKR